MYTEYDPQHEAEAAMKRAAEAEGADRQRLIQLALAWHELARDLRDEHARSLGSSRAQVSAPIAPR
ncbi:hypothetical protein [Bradyrhizobium sp. DOA9]|uniref:hypothetical protein n=1 Tax=Bradyrhizobium sp. DOA9 TaxID=1126627 RepID=UPI00046890A3|nr:hypothetical protein [Bradyrhizobium sp. DOA9]